MKVPVYATVDVEAEAHVSTEEIRAALIEDMTIAQQIGGKAYPAETLCRSLHQCLSAITEEMIGRLAEDLRAIMAKELRELADKFEPPLTQQPPGGS